VKRVALIAVLLLAGCVGSAEHVLEATARAENRIGKSGSVALEGVGVLTSALAATSSQATTTLAAIESRTTALLDNTAGAMDKIGDVLADLRPAIQGLAPVVSDIGGITSETRAVIALTRQNAEDGVYWKRALLVVGIIAACSLVHSILSARRTHKRVAAIHEDVRRLHPGHHGSAPPGS